MSMSTLLGHCFKAVADGLVGQVLAEPPFLKVKNSILHQVDIIISKKQALQILYLKYYVYKTTLITMDKKPTKSTKI